ncbi:MAG: NAD-dependent epimerase/dehydratase family protein [Sporomusaceae bacterium]|jgi:UDP-glucose 4-epimerase|nr:NAD-dependent epimerase/dehydratase family protein [Sporomusaceae bacterium]
MAEKVLVTGGAGFIGYHVVKTLLAKNYQVVVLDNLSTGLKSNVPNAAKFIETDILAAEIPAIFAAEKFDHVIHLAAQTMVPFSLKQPEKDAEINILGTLKILNAAKNTGVKRLVFASSAAVYGDLAAIPLQEDALTVPTSFYGLSKLTVEKYLALYYQLFGLNYSVLRFANVYGEKQGEGGEGGVVSIFVRQIEKDAPLTVFGDGGQTRDFIYAGDVAEAVCATLNAPPAKINRVYNVSTQQQTSVNDLTRLLTAAAGKDVQINYQEPRPGDIYHSMLDNSSLSSMLNWRPEVDLAAGLKKTYSDLIRRNEN